MDAMLSEMEGAASQFLTALGQFASPWYQKQVEEAVSSKPDAVQAAGVEGLRQLKAELKELRESTPDLVQQRANIDRYWSHRDRSYWLHPSEKRGGPFHDWGDYAVYSEDRRGQVRGPAKLKSAV